MNTRQLVGTVAGLMLLAACAQPAQPAAPGASSAASVPATSAGASDGNDIEGFMGAVVAAQRAVRTYAIDMRMQAPVAGSQTEIVMKGVIDQTDPANINMRMDMDMGGLAMKTLKVDGDMYVQLGATGTKWMKVPKDQMAQYESTTDSADLTVGLEKAKGAMKSIDLVGEEAVDGVATKHYRITVDAKGLSSITGSDASLADEDFAYDVWLDASSRLRKVAMDVTARADGEDLPLKVAATMGRYDEPVSITAPAAKDVVEMDG